jgi:multicomponent Na+:H+ antiporter subunit G
MNAVHILALALYAAGVAVVVVSGLAALAFRWVHDRLHFLTPTTSLGAPLIGFGLALEDGWTLTTAEILFTCLLLVVSGPVLAAATGRLAAQRQGALRQESPE